MSASVIAFVSALVFGGTQAFFSDEERSTGNTFTAGEIDLTVDSVAHYNGLVCVNDLWHPEGSVVWNDDDLENPFLEVVPQGNDIDEDIEDFNTQNPNNYPQAGEDCEGTWELTDLGPEHTFFNYGDLKPGDHGENTISLHLETNDGYACAIIDNLQDDDNGVVEPEGEAGDTTPGDGEGELSEELRFFAWLDDGDNIWEDGEAELFSNTEGPAGDVIDGVVYPLFTPETEVMPANSTAYIGLYWCYGAITVDAGNNTLACDGASVTNMTQTDSLMADISFYVEQSRNNEAFECPILDEEEEEDRVVEDSGDGWSPEAADQTAVLGVDRWVAKARYGDNNPTAGAYELEVGFGPGSRDEQNTSYVDSVSQAFSLVYDDTTKIATVMVGSDSATYDLTGVGTPQSVGITAKGGSDDATSLTNITVDGLAVADLVSPTTGNVFTSLSGSAIEGDFTILGDLTFTLVSPQDELPALQIDVLTN